MTKMMICSQCNKTFGHESKFCSDCGVPLTELTDNTASGGQYRNTDMAGAEGYGTLQSNGMGSPGLNESSAQNPAGYPAGYGMSANPAGYPAASQAGTAARKTGAGAIAGMFLVNCIPILGFPAAFLWAQAKMKRAKGKLVAFTAAFMALNITVTILAYALSINMMKNSLAKAAQNAMVESKPTGGNQQVSVQQYATPSVDHPGGNTEDNPVQDYPGLDSGLPEQIIPGFAGMQQGYDPGIYQVPEDVTMPETDEDGNMHVDTDGGGVADMITDPSGNIIQSNGIALPKTDEHGNMYLDTDGDGEYDSYLDNISGMIIPLDERTKTDAKGNRYIDYDGDGIYEFMVDIEGVTHFDVDGDGVYETLDQISGQG